MISKLLTRYSIVPLATVIVLLSSCAHNRFFLCTHKNKINKRLLNKVALSRCQNGICLVSRQAQTDKDKDGVSDPDEKALGTSPNNPLSFPSMTAIISKINNGTLESFNKGLNLLIVFPDKTPDGKPVGSTQLSGYKRETLKQLGITDKTLKTYGLSFESGFSISSAMPEGMTLPKKASEKPPVAIRVGGIDMALYSQEESPTGGETVLGGGAHNDKTWGDKFKEAAKKESPSDDGLIAWEVAKIVVKEAIGPSYKVLAFVADWASKPAKPKNQPDGGINRTDPELSLVVFIPKKDYEWAWFKSKGGPVARPVNPVTTHPVPTDNPPPEVLGKDPNGPIILTNPDQTDYPSKHTIIIIPLPVPKDKKEQITNFGPFGPAIIDMIRSGSGKPKTGLGPTDDPRFR